MGMGYAGTHGWILTSADLKKICPDEFAAVEAALALIEPDEDGPYTLARYTQAINNGEVITGVIDEAIVNLDKAFVEKTKVGDSKLHIYLGYYDADSGDMYDEMEDGEYWEVGGMEALTPAGAKLKEISDVAHQAWVHLG
jgi:hypothetical protein